MAATAACNNSNSHSSNSNGSSPSPPQSPRRRCSRRQCSIPPRRTLRRSSKSLLSISVGHDLIPVIRRCLRYWLLIPLLYVWGLIVCICPISIFILPHHHIPPAPGSVYRSDEVFKAVWSDMQMDNSSGIKMSAMWRYNKKLKLPDDNDQIQRPCLTRSIKKQHHNSSVHITNNTDDSPKLSPTLSSSNSKTRISISENHPTVSPVRYLIVEANGGLNQQRASICNAVVVAGLLNATLVIPLFNYHNVWMDRSEFGDIYDSDHFITTLNTSINVVRELPPMSLSIEKFNNSISNIPATHVPAWATIQYYLEEIDPILQKQGVIRIAPFANRLAMNIPPDYQHLRCLANYKALKFAPSISTLAKQLVKRLVEKSKVHDGKYVSVHLRFEEDMVAFSCCMYAGGRQETTLMESIRKRGWKGKFEKRRRDQNAIDPGLNRMNGKCPLTPVEVGMMLRGMGFTNTTIIYLASGKLYQPQNYLTPLLQMFPLVYTKETLTTPEELASFHGYSSRLAAVDYIVCLLSEVFVTTQGGNFPHFLMGHRRFMYGGHAKTIKPNKMKLVRMFHNTTVSWGVVREEMKLMLVESNREGMMMGKKRKSRRRNSIYEYPFQDCKCVQHFSSLNSMEILDNQQLYSVL